MIRSLTAAVAVSAIALISPHSGAATTVPGDSVAETASPAALAYAEPGPYPVGVTTMTLPTGLVVEVWYPAVEGSAAIETYDMRDFVPAAIRDVLTGDVQATFSYAAARDAAAADGTFPVVVFSHGYAGMRLQSSFLTSHLASWGFVVLSADHASRDLSNVLGNTATGDRAAASAEMWAAYDAVVDPAATAPWAGRIDPDQVVLVGHSAGGSTVLQAAGDARTDGAVVLAAGQPDGVPVPAATTLFMAGANDGVVPAASTRAAFDAAPAPSWYWELADVGHNGFDDFCTVGGGRGLIGIAEASGLGPFLESQPQLRTLGLDGCEPPNSPVIETFGPIRHAVTSFARWASGQDPAPVQLDEAPAAPPTITVVRQD
jgi:dienelactone hydrolase